MYFKRKNMSKIKLFKNRKGNKVSKDAVVEKHRSLIDKIDACDIALRENMLYATDPTSFMQLRSNWMATIPEECYPEIKEVIAKWRDKFKQQLTEL